MASLLSPNTVAATTARPSGRRSRLTPSVTAMATKGPKPSSGGTKRSSGTTTVFPVGKPAGPPRPATTKGSAPVKLLTNVEKLRLLTKAEKAGLLSAAERAGLRCRRSSASGCCPRRRSSGCCRPPPTLAPPARCRASRSCCWPPAPPSSSSSPSSTPGRWRSRPSPPSSASPGAPPRSPRPASCPGSRAPPADLDELCLLQHRPSVNCRV
uniref:Uncharacterized protein n=1 Tax=Triticum urartu TaxID=4572 RepID=A0A8R7QB93_TRIUA